MGDSSWNVSSMPAYKSRTPEEVDILWKAAMPPRRDADPALWDALIGFFEDAIVASCSRPGRLVVTPREIMKQLKHNGSEPASGMRVIEELYKRGDIRAADTLKAPSKEASPYSMASVKATLGSYIWGTAKPKAPSMDDPIVPMTALKRVKERVPSLAGPMASADIHTVKTFASAITGNNMRDAEAVISYIISQGEGSALFTDPSPENPDPILGVKLGKGSATEADKGLLRTKAALERMEDLSMHLGEAIQAEKEAATTAVKAGNKTDALMRMRKKKVLETKLNGARAAANKLSDVLLAVDEAESNREAVSAMETGMASLKVATDSGITADRVDAVAADFDEALGDQEDVRVALQQLSNGSTENDAALEEELEAMMADEAGASKTETVEDTPEQLELAKLIAECNIAPEDAAKLEEPEKVAVAEAAQAMAQASKFVQQSVTAALAEEATSKQPTKESA